METFTLNNGVVIENSNNSRNRTGYRGVALNLVYTSHDNETPFAAECGLPNDPTIKAQLNINKRTAWHGGFYSDAREAAYVVALFKENPIAIDSIISKNSVFDNFPSDLYDLSVFLTLKDAQRIVNLKLEEIRRVKQTNKRTIRTRVNVKVNNSPVEKYWKELYVQYNIANLAEKFGKETIITARKYLTVNEFELRFGL